MAFLGIKLPFWEARRKRLALRGYVRRLPPLLAANYGRLASYTPEQVRRTIAREGLNEEYSCYALAMFSGRGDYDLFHELAGVRCDFDAMRSEIAEAYVNSAGDFSVSDVYAAASTGEPGMSDGHHGGGGHGHH